MDRHDMKKAGLCARETVSLCGTGGTQLITFIHAWYIKYALQVKKEKETHLQHNMKA